MACPCNESNTATLEITSDGSGGYSVSPDPLIIDIHGCIEIVFPVGGVVLCLSGDFRSHGNQINLTDAESPKTFGTFDTAGDSWIYTVQGPGTSCTGRGVTTGGHTIIVGGGGGGTK